MANDIRQKFVIEVDGEGKIKAYTGDLKKNEEQVKKVDKASKGLTGSLAKLAVGFASLATAKKIAQITWELGELGSQALTVDKSFKQFARQGGRDAQKMLADLRKASGGLADDMFLQQQAMKAMIAGVDFSAVVTSLEYVRRYAIATGDDMNQKFQTVMTGLARGSAQFLDDVGIQVMGSKDVVNDAVAQMQEKMVQFADTSSDVSTKIAEMKTEFRNLKIYLGEQLAPTIGSLAEKTKSFIEGFGDLFKGLQIERMEGLQEAIKVYEKTIDDTMRRRDAQFEKYKKSGKKKYLDQARDTRELLGVLNENLNRAKDQYERIYNSIYGVVDQTSEAVVTRTKAMTEEEKKALEDRLKMQKKALLEIELFGKDKFEQEVVNTKRHFNEMASLFGRGSDERVAIEEELNKRLQDIYFRRNVDMRKGLADDSMELPWTDADTNALEELLKSGAPDELYNSLKTKFTDYVDYISSGLNSLKSVYSSVYDARIRDSQATATAETEIAKSSVMTEKQKAKEIKRIQDKARKEQFAIRMKQWRMDLLTATANTAVAVSSALKTEPFVPAGIAAGIAAGVSGAAQIATIAANKPRFYYGSRDSSGNYREIGGNSTGDTITAQVRSGEAIVPMTSENRARLNGTMGVVNRNNINIGAPSITVNGSVDRSVMDEFYKFRDSFADKVAEVVERNSVGLSNTFNRAYA